MIILGENVFQLHSLYWRVIISNLISRMSINILFVEPIDRDIPNRLQLPLTVAGHAKEDGKDGRHCQEGKENSLHNVVNHLLLIICNV